MYGYLILDINVGKNNFTKMIDIFNDLGLIYTLFAILMCIILYILYLNNDK